MSIEKWVRHDHFPWVLFACFKYVITTCIFIHYDIKQLLSTKRAFVIYLGVLLIHIARIVRALFQLGVNVFYPLTRPILLFCADHNCLCVFVDVRTHTHTCTPNQSDGHILLLTARGHYSTSIFFRISLVYILNVCDTFGRFTVMLGDSSVCLMSNFESGTFQQRR